MTTNAIALSWSDKWLIGPDLTATRTESLLRCGPYGRTTYLDRGAPAGHHRYARDAVVVSELEGKSS